MKTIKIATLLIFAALSACKQKQTPPSSATAEFNKMYPGAKSKWTKEDDGTWEIKFSNNGVKTSVSFLNDGSLKEIEEESSYDSLPANAKVYLETNSLNNKVEEVEKITTADKHFTYEVEVNESEILFDEAGNFLKEIKDDE